MKNKLAEGRRPGVWIVAGDAELRESLADICRLAALDPTPVDPGDSAIPCVGVGGRDLVVAEIGVDVPESLGSLRRITVYSNQGGGDPQGHADVVVPRDEVALLHLLTRTAEEGDRFSRSKDEVVALVGSWHGGGGATTASQRLARSSRSVLLDAAGNWGGDLTLEEEALTWDDIDPVDLPPSARLIANLPRIAGVPTLTMNTGVPVRPDDPRVFAVANALKRCVVVDCGVHLDALFALAARLEGAEKRVATVLTGTGGERGAAALGRWKSSNSQIRDPVYLLNGRPHPIFHSVADRFDLRWQRLPRVKMGRGWRKIQEKLWAA